MCVGNYIRDSSKLVHDRMQIYAYGVIKLMMADGLLLETLLEDPVFSAFVFYSVMILTKMVLVQSWTTVIRFQYRVSSQHNN